MDESQKSTYDAIASRCRGLTPSLDIAKHIKQGTLRVANNTLDGITFEAVDPAELEAELDGRTKIPGSPQPPSAGSGPLASVTARQPRPANASMTSMKEDPTHWALKASFGETIGQGYREQWRPPPRPLMSLVPTSNYGSKRISLRFGEAGRRLSFTALHAAVAARVCSIHIDERGFVMSTPQGAVVTASFWAHLANELLLKTRFRDWLDGLIGDTLVGPVVVEVVNRVSLRFPDVENSFAGLQSRVNRISGPGDFKGIGSTLLPIGVSADLARLKNSTVQADYYWHDGHQTLLISWAGTHNLGSR